MYQGKLDVLKQEMARVKIDVIGINNYIGQELMNLMQIAIMSTTNGKNSIGEME